MPEWGWNPSTLQTVISGVVGIATVGTLIVIWFGTRAAQRTANLAMSEAEHRNRSRVRITSCRFIPESNTIEMIFDNVGMFEAYFLRISLDIDIFPVVARFDEPMFHDIQKDIVFPGEPVKVSWASIEIRRRRENDLELRRALIRGHLSYGRYLTDFEAELLFENNECESVYFHHISAT